MLKNPFSLNFLTVRGIPDGRQTEAPEGAAHFQVLKKLELDITSLNFDYNLILQQLKTHDFNFWQV